MSIPNPSPGTFFSAAFGVLDPTATQDTLSTHSVATPIVVTTRTVWLHFGDSASRKDFNEIEVYTDDLGMTLYMEAASNSSEFATPTIVTPVPRTLTVSPFGEQKFYLATDVTNDRFYRLTFTSSASLRRFMDAYKAEVILEHRF